jgi:hypothetical protein
MTLGGPGSAGAAGPPQISSSWVTEVTASGASLRALIDPEGVATRYRFEYLSEAAYQANLDGGSDGFAGAVMAPPGSEAVAGSGTTEIQVNQHIGGLAPLATYHYRVRATSSLGTAYGPERTFTTQGTSLVFSLLDQRAWEMVSPVDKNGGAIESVGTTAPRVFQAAADGQSVTYDSVSSFGDPSGAPAVSQYLSGRGGSGWTAENISLPLLSGSYGDVPSTTPYLLFAPDLSASLALNGRRCRGEEGECPVANPPLPGSGAPAGFVDYYRRDAAGVFTALLTEADAASASISPASFQLKIAAAAPDLAHVVLSTCAALTPDATEVATGVDSCDPEEPNLYEWSAAGLEIVNRLPGQSERDPGAEVAAQGLSVAADGSRVYWVDGHTEGLYVHVRGSTSVQVDAAVGGGGRFETASADGSVAYFSKEGHLYRYELAAGTTTDLTPEGGLEGVLGASADGSYVYYETAGGLWQAHGGSARQIAAEGDPRNYPASTGTARVSADGQHLLFLSSASLTGYDNAGQPEVFLYGPPPEGGAARLVCVSCNPTGERPLGGSSIPGAVSNGEGAEAVAVYKPRSLSAGGNRVFFDTGDALVVQDTNRVPDAYEWEASGVGTCGESRGCVQLIGNGRSEEGSSFVDASADGADAFFLTDASLVAGDPGLVDLYDARIGGGFPVPGTPIPCDGDSCQPLPPAPEDPTPGTLVPNPGNPVQRAQPKPKHHHKKKRHRRHRRGHRSKRATS